MTPPQMREEMLLNTIAISWIPFYINANKQQYNRGKKLLEEQLTKLALPISEFTNCFIHWLNASFKLRRYYIEQYKEAFGVPLEGKARGEIIVEDVVKLSDKPYLDNAFINLVMERR